MTNSNFTIDRYIQQSFIKYPKMEDFLKQTQRFRWKYRAGVFSIINNETGVIYVGSSRDLAETISLHVKKKTKTNRYIAIKQTKLFSLYIMELLHLSAGDSFMKQREIFYFNQIPKQQRVQLTDQTLLWSFFD